VDQSYWIVKE